MGQAVGRGTDYAIVTSDNPRFEDPAAIARGAVEGLESSGRRGANFETILDRDQAIEKAIHKAKPGDCVLIAGKGHEPYQEIHGKRYKFDDRRIAREILAPLSKNWKQNPEVAKSDATTTPTGGEELCG